jgi:hypothetical protein
MRLSNYILSSTLQIVTKNREAYFKINDQADRIIVWLVGFSIATIALIISKVNLISDLSQNLPFVLIIFCSLTIIFGILYRIFLFIAQFLENHLLLKFEAYVGSLNWPRMDTPRFLKETEPIEDLIKYFKNDFDIDFSNLSIKDFTPQQIETYRSILFSHYINSAIVFQNQLNSELDEISNVLKSHFGYSDKKLAPIKNPKKSNKVLPRIFWICFYVAHILFLLTILIFMIGVIVFLFNFIQYKICH